jgi:hypothetical protein
MHRQTRWPAESKLLGIHNSFKSSKPIACPPSSKICCPKLLAQVLSKVLTAASKFEENHHRQY